ncbi:MAG: protein-L-isoaspartate(D-aspartate) O-methyltransferase [Pseudomonadota bacterium]
MKSSIKRMLAEIEGEAAYTRRLTGTSKLDPRVMAAMGKVSREVFVSPDLKRFAYDNGPLPIGYGQTISQPYIVALMTDLLQLEPEHIVLEVGTGSGYQAAVLSQLVKKVFTIERIPVLGDASAARLKSLGYGNIECRTGNGYDGWPEHAPYDSIIVTAAASHIPQALIEQLKYGGRLVIPVGLPGMPQELMLVEKDDRGGIHTRNILGVAFVPLQEENPVNSSNGISE